MKLIKVNTKGFKSFAERIILDFNGDVVAIVGPNGSGKSNINDAIKWVLGEQSMKQLRGDKAEDIIFSGSKTLPQAKVGEVSLTFDNSEGNSKIPHKKITITRRISRGESGNQYFVNGEIARLKDIKEIAMESGIGKSSLAIIGQGTISDIAEASPEDRRFVFEEAAGISKYKARKKEALRKLDYTSEALDKVRTITKELEKQVGPLKRQADKAKLYLEKKASLKDVEIGLISDDLKFFGAKLEKLTLELEDVIFSKNNLNIRVDEIGNTIDEKTSYKYKLENEIQNLQNDLEVISDKILNIDIRNNKASHQRQLIMDGQMKSTSAEMIEAMKGELDELSAKLQSYTKWLDDSKTAIETKKSEVAENKLKHNRLEYEHSDIRQKAMQIKTKLNMLKDFRDNKSNLFKGTKTIIDNKNSLSGVEGIVAELLEVPTEYKNAIESLLANVLQNVVVRDSSEAVKGVNFLKQNKSGRATFIPLNSIKPKRIASEHLNIAQNQNGFVSIGSEIINTKPQYEILNKFLLGNIILAEDIESATAIARTLNNIYMVVTLEGDIVRSGGVVSGGQKQKSRDLLGNDEQINKLEEALPLIDVKLKEKAQIMNNILSEVGESNSIIAELSIERASVQEKHQSIQKSFDSLRASFEAQTNTTFKAKNIKLENSPELYESQKSSLKTLLKAKRESVITINNDLAHLTTQKIEFEKMIREINDKSADQIKGKTEAEFVIKAHTKRLLEEYELTIENAKENFTLKMPIEDARTLVDTIRSEIREIGNVNLDSIEAYDEVKERYEKYTSSEEELFSAQQTIISAINEMDKIIISKLDQTVKDVNLEFNKVFTKMFGGGFAEIKYTNPSNLLETGIDVIAQPPGKTVKNLRLFSGGEKAMIAISLLFAVLKSRPLPLCILDEVEAPLDETNVERFASYLQELKAQTQFIVITHRFGTMARVDSIFGATMQNKGSTSFFSVKLAEAKKYIEEQ